MQTPKTNKTKTLIEPCINLIVLKIKLNENKAKFIFLCKALSGHFPLTIGA
jgi:hypothetical protein